MLHMGVFLRTAKGRPYTLVYVTYGWAVGDASPYNPDFYFLLSAF